jgi:hypothetical protein
MNVVRASTLFTLRTVLSKQRASRGWDLHAGFAPVTINHLHERDHKACPPVIRAITFMQTGTNCMAKFEFTEFERVSLGEMHAITTDCQGRDVLFGLNSEETEFLMKFRQNKSWHSSEACNTIQRAEELQHKHNLARHEVLGALIHLRNGRLIRH